MTLLQLDAATVASRLNRGGLIVALDAAFRQVASVPTRPHYRLPPAADGTEGGTLLIMPAWRGADSLGIKIVTVFPGNARHDLPAVHALYVLLDAATGRPRAILDGEELTLRRTGAASALASRYLSRPDASRLLMVGTGKLAPHLVESHVLVRPIREVRIWGRRLDRAQELAATLCAGGLSAAPTADLEAATRWADIISCATLSHDALIRGVWLRPGQHVDLVGSFNAAMREVDDEAIKRCELYVDTRAGALSDSGELIGAIARGIIDAAAIRAELSELALGHPGRGSDSSITLFKSVGTAIEDLAAAEMAMITG